MTSHDEHMRKVLKLIASERGEKKRKPSLRPFAAIAHIRKSRRVQRCYEMAGEVMLSADGDKLTLCHGTVKGGIPHAWLELADGSTHCPVFWEPVRDAIVERRYTKEEAAKMVVKHGHWGKWHRHPIEDEWIAQMKKAKQL
jgi:hypothetical protein